MLDRHFVSRRRQGDAATGGRTLGLFGRAGRARMDCRLASVSRLFYRRQCRGLRRQEGAGSEGRGPGSGCGKGRGRATPPSTKAGPRHDSQVPGRPESTGPRRGIFRPSGLSAGSGTAAETAPESEAPGATGQQGQRDGTGQSVSRPGALAYPAGPGMNTKSTGLLRRVLMSISP